ncbi:MAG: response regulator [Deltaproteobacteria bacterium]|nr:response regulator [Deltaproteobacteria bacterium]
MGDRAETRILVVDDDPAVRALFTSYLHADGFTVDEADDVDVALEALNGRAYAVVVVDIVMPGGSGLDVLRAVKAKSPECDVIVASANATRARAIEALNAGASQLLEKPLEDVGLLGHAIRSALERRRLSLRTAALTREIERKNSALEVTNRRLTALHHAGRVLTSLHSMKVIFQEIVEIISRELMSSRVSIMRIVEDRDVRARRLEMQAAVGVPDEAWHARPLVGEGIAGYVAKSGKPLCINDHTALKGEAPDFAAFVLEDAPREPFPKSLTVPVMVKERVIGVVNVTGLRDGGTYTQPDIEFVQNLVAQAGFVLANAELIQEIIAARDFNATVLDAVPYPIVVLDDGMRMVAENRAYRELFSTPSFVAQTTPLGVLPLALASREVVRDSLSRISRGKEPVKLYDLSGVTPDGTRAVYDFTLCALENAPRGARYVALFEDVTRKRRIEARIMQEDKMASLGILAAGVAHEVNNPMAYIKANTTQLGEYFESLRRVVESWQAVGNEPGLDDAVGDAVLRAQSVEAEVDVASVLKDLENIITENLEGIRRVQSIVGDLRSFAHPEPSRPTECEINRLVQRAANLSRHEVKSGSTLDIELNAHQRFLGFPQRIEQVLINLIVNAAQSVQNGHGAIRVKTFDETAHVCVSVSDTGCGISPEHIKRIFEPFFTTKDVGQGMGMGLSLSYKIIQDHGGRIDVESELGKGSAFTLRLPAAR